LAEIKVGSNSDPVSGEVNGDGGVTFAISFGRITYQVD
jgi:hypothetical protein